MKSSELLCAEALKNQPTPISSREARELRTRALVRFAELLDENKLDHDFFGKVTEINPSVIMQFWNYYRTWLDDNIVEDSDNYGVKKASILSVTHDQATYYEVALINDALSRNMIGNQLS